MRRAIIVAAAVLAACSSVTSGPSARQKQQDLLRADEIEQASAGTLHDAIRLLRPHFLFSRGRTSIRAPNPATPIVIVNNVPQGSLEALRLIAPGEVLYVRLLRAPEATTRFGTGYMSGAIEVVLR